MNDYKALKINGKRIDEHRKIMQDTLGVRLQSNDVVHHINEDKQDNRLENLQLMSRSEHSKLHMTGRSLADNTIEKLKVIMHDRWASGSLDFIKKPIAAFDKQGNLIRIYNSIREASRFGFNRAHIYSCCIGKRRTHKEMIWRFI